MSSVVTYKFLFHFVLSLHLINIALQFVFKMSAFGFNTSLKACTPFLGKTDIHFIEPEVKINGAYYRDYLLSEKLLLGIRQYSDYFTFQQDGASAHRAREIVEYI